MELLQKETDIYAFLDALLKQESYWNQKSWVWWLEEGDKNSKYFHTCAKLKVVKVRMSSLVDKGEVLTDNQAIDQCILRYYQSL